MRDSIMAAQAEGEQAGDFNLANQKNQVMCYAQELEPPRPNANGRRRRDLWYHCAAQEMTLISPRMFDEFMLHYQQPIIESFGLAAYGCCENLTDKIHLLRRIRNLRMIAVTPVADVARCAEQIGPDYVFSWRPNPANMVCTGFDEDYVRGYIRQGLHDAKGCHVHVLLKDVETVQGDISRLSRWVRAVRAVIE